MALDLRGALRERTPAPLQVLYPMGSGPPIGKILPFDASDNRLLAPGYHFGNLLPILAPC